MTLIAFITEPVIISAILTHSGESVTPPPLAPRARARPALENPQATAFEFDQSVDWDAGSHRPDPNSSTTRRSPRKRTAVPTRRCPPRGRVCLVAPRSPASAGVEGIAHSQRSIHLSAAPPAARFPQQSSSVPWAWDSGSGYGNGSGKWALDYLSVVDSRQQSVTSPVRAFGWAVA